MWVWERRRAQLSSAHFGYCCVFWNIYCFHELPLQYWSLLRPVQDAVSRLELIELLSAFPKTDIWAIFTRLREAKCDKVYSIVTSSLEQDTLVSLTGLVWNGSHLHSEQFHHAVRVNSAKHSIENCFTKGPARLVHLLRAKDEYPPRRGRLDIISMFS